MVNRTVKVVISYFIQVRIKVTLTFQKIFHYNLHIGSVGSIKKKEISPFPEAGFSPPSKKRKVTV